jgi:hypothetical protein
MKLFLYLVPVVTILMANSCSKKDVELREGTLELTLKRCGNGEIAGNNLRLCFDSLITDSRCPANAMCIWQGTATAKFSFTKDNETKTFVLSTLDMPPTYTKDTVLMGYKIEFVNLSPYPGTVPMPVPADKIKAELKITKQ